MTESAESVKAVAAFLRGAAEKNTNPETRALLIAHADTADWAADEIIRLKGLTSALPPDLGNVYDLPPDLLEELSIAKADQLDDQLVTVINAYGGEASLDQVLVGLYRKFKVSQKRRFIQNKLYRMEMIWSVDGKKGIYTTTKPPERPTDDPDLERDLRLTSVDLEDEVPF